MRLSCVVHKIVVHTVLLDQLRIVRLESVSSELRRGSYVRGLHKIYGIKYAPEKLYLLRV